MSKKLVATSVALLALGTGALGYAQFAAADETPSTTPTASAPSEPSAWHGKGKGHRGGPKMDTAQLASKLGVDESKLTDALKKVRDAMRSANQGRTARPDPAVMHEELTKGLATELGLDQAKVKAAMNEIRAANEAEHKAAFKKVLDQAVTDGKLTQSEADAVVKAAEQGVIHMGQGPRGR